MTDHDEEPDAIREQVEAAGPVEDSIDADGKQEKARPSRDGLGAS